jgi:hypothetical protein
MGTQRPLEEHAVAHGQKMAGLCKSSGYIKLYAINQRLQWLASKTERVQESVEIKPMRRKSYEDQIEQNPMYTGRLYTY